MNPRSLVVLALLGALAPAGAARATGAWQTYLHLSTCEDILALRDTVLIASGEAGLVRYIRSEDRFESVTREPGGLASNAITAMAYDRSGRLWCGTPGKGVSRLAADGSTWDLVNAFDGLPSDTVTVVEADGDTMWIGTPRGIALWDGAQIAGAVPDVGSPSPFRSNVVTGIVLVHDSLFVGTADGVFVSRLSTDLASWEALDTGLLNRQIVSMASDGREVFALAGGATYRFNMGSRTWGVAGGQGTVRYLADDMGRIVCSTPIGLWAWNVNAWAAIAGSPLADATPTGGIVFASDPDGHRFAFQNAAFLEEGSPAWTTRIAPGPVGNNVQNVLVDGSRVWMNTFAEGVGRFDGSTWRNWTPGCCGTTQDTAFVSPAFAFLLLRDTQGRKWIANWDYAIERIDDSVNPPLFEHVLIAPPSSDTLSKHTLGWSSAVDDTGYIYLGFDTSDRGGREPVGVDVYGLDGTRIVTWKATNSGMADNQVRAIAFDRYRHAWLGFPSVGVSRSVQAIDAAGFPGRVRVPQFATVSRTEGLDIFGIVAHGDSIWVLSTAKLQRFNASTSALVTESQIPAAPAPRGAVRPIDVAPDGTVWVASVDGVRRYKVGGGFEDFKVSNSPLADNEVRAVAVEPSTGAVWIGTASGLNRYDPQYAPPAPPRLSRLAVTVYPNPVTLTGIGLELRLGGNAASYSGEILDLNGRILRRFVAGGNGRVIWDGRDHDGRLVPPGVYFVRARGGGQQGSARLVVLR